MEAIVRLGRGDDNNDDDGGNDDDDNVKPFASHH